MIKSKKFDIFSYLLLLVFFAAFNYFMLKNMDLLLDSDMSNELILAQIMAKEKSLLSTNWYYSTELRVFNTQYIFAPLFLLTDNYHIVRNVGTIILELILLLSFIYMSKQLSFKNIPYLSIFIIGCCSKEYFDFFIKAPHYIPYLFTTFIEIGLLASIYNSDNNKENKIKYVIFLILSLISSMNGLRELEALYLPLFCSVIGFVIVEFLFKKQKINNKQKELITMVCVSFVLSIVGYFVSNNILSLKYSIYREQFGYSLRIPTLSIIKDTLYCILACFGYVNCCGTFFKISSLLISISLIIVSILICINIIFINNKYSIVEKIIAYLYLISCAETILILLLTTIPTVPRYLQLNTILCIVIIGIYISRNLNNYEKYYVVLLYIFVVVNSFLVLNYEIINSRNVETKEIVKILNENKIKNGVASFWNASIINEISDGEIDVWHYRTSSDLNIEDLVTIANGDWLQNKDHLLNMPTGKVFYIIDEDTKIVDENKISSYLVYKGNTRNLYIFDSYGDFKDNLLRSGR